MHEEAKYSISDICKSMNIVRSSYYKWLTDVTEFKYGIDKKAYLSAILDLGDNHIVAWVLGHNNNNELVFRNFDMAVEANPEAHPIFHSD